MAKKALIAGATGLIGKELLALLLADPTYEQVIALVRKPLPIQHKKFVQQLTDFDHLEEVSEHLRDVADVFCTLGTTIKVAKTKEAFRKVDYEYPVRLAQLAMQNEVQQFLIVTSMGANRDSGIFYNQVKGEVEEEIRGIGLPASHIFRPSLLLGDRAESRLGEQIGSVLARVLSPFMVGGLHKYRPIHVKTVAQAMVHTARSQVKGEHVYLSEEIANRGNAKKAADSTQPP
jgi:uncharacterized protein YbjT (DUF2867 family)